MKIPRPEYPRPQFVRESWMNLNGIWQFEFDPGCSGEARGVWEKEQLNGEIVVPFCPESRLSGIGDVDFHPSVWYRRAFTLDAAQAAGRVLLHFGAVDYTCACRVNGRDVGWHDGGCSSFTFDVTDAVCAGENTIVLRAEDTSRGPQPVGKQSQQYHSRGCSYTRTTGIWQTVWLEFVPETYMTGFFAEPCARAGRVDVEVGVAGKACGCAVRVTALLDGKPVGESVEPVVGGRARARIPLAEKRLWDVGQPDLYDLRFELLCGGETADTAAGYFGLRDVEVREGALWLNDRPVYMRLVLDQGFNPEGIYTAPDDDFLRGDIELSMWLGFNGARLHQRIFEERTYYWADRLGYILWGEFPSWGVDTGSANGVKYFAKEWTEIVRRDRSHPALVGWCPFNETWDAGQDRAVVTTAYALTKALDPTRPVIDTSGGNHYETDMYDVHDYEQDPAAFAEHYEPVLTGAQPIVRHISSGSWRGEAFWVSEYGGTWWNPGAEGKGWGYGVAPKGEAEFASRYSALTGALLAHPRICGFCYTQLTDVEQEQNGLVKYDRSPKFPPEVYEAIRAANTGAAAIEEKRA